MGKAKRPPCPNPGKKRWTYQGEAVHAAIGASRSYGKPMRHYHCICGG